MASIRPSRIMAENLKFNSAQPASTVESGGDESIDFIFLIWVKEPGRPYVETVHNLPPVQAVAPVEH